jgi:hypothetical protein
MLTGAQISGLCDIGQSVADDRQGDVDRLVKEGALARDGDFYELTARAEKVLTDRGAGLNEA